MSILGLRFNPVHVWIWFSTVLPICNRDVNPFLPHYCVFKVGNLVLIFTELIADGLV